MCYASITHANVTLSISFSGKYEVQTAYTGQKAGIPHMQRFSQSQQIPLIAVTVFLPVGRRAVNAGTRPESRGVQVFSYIKKHFQHKWMQTVS